MDLVAELTRSEAFLVAQCPPGQLPATIVGDELMAILDQLRRAMTNFDTHALLDAAPHGPGQRADDLLVAVRLMRGAVEQHCA